MVSLRATLFRLGRLLMKHAVRHLRSHPHPESGHSMRRSACPLCANNGPQEQENDGSPSNPLLASGQPRNYLAERKPETGRRGFITPNTNGCGALLYRVRDELRGVTMNYETCAGEFVLCFWITISKGFKRCPIGACDTVVDRPDMIAWLDVRCDCGTA